MIDELKEYVSTHKLEEKTMTKEEAILIIGNIPINQLTVDKCYSISQYQEAKTMAIEALENQKEGHWIIELDSREHIEGWKNMNCKCSNCGKILIKQDYNDSMDYEEESRDLLQSKYVTKANYCSNCGAKMKGE